MRVEDRRNDEAQEAKRRNALPRKLAIAVLPDPIPLLHQSPNVLEQFPKLTVGMHAQQVTTSHLGRSLTEDIAAWRHICRPRTHGTM